MNLGKGFQIPQENGVIYNGDPWIPVTPEKLVMPTTNPIPDEMPGSLTRRTNWQEQVGIQSLLTPKKPVIQPTTVPGEMLGDQTERTYWSELLGLYTGVLQETPSNEALPNLNPTGLLGEHNKQDGVIIEPNGCLNQNAGSYIQSFTNDAPVRNNNSLIELFGNKYTPDILPNDGTAYRSIHAADKLSSTGSYPPVGNRWTEFQSASSMLLEQTHAMHPNQRLISSSLQEIQSDGYPVPYRSIYNLNSPPRAETAAPSCATNCFQFAPVTPDQRKQLKNDQLCDTQNFSVDESLRQGKDKQAIVSTNSQIGNPCDELLHSVITSPFASNLTTQKGKNISDDGGHGSIDLNKTPQQRPPKRKKHRPKVVREGKPKRTPKPTAAKANISNENPSGKRKYVRRKGLDTSTSGQQNEMNGLEASGATSVTKSCRRVLNFDVEDNIHDKSENWTGDNQAEMHLQREPFDLNLISQDTTGSTGFKTVSEISAAKEGQLNGHCEEKLHCKSTCNLIHANNQRPAEKSLPLTPTAPPITVRDHTLNVIARSLNLKNATACQSNDQSGYIQGHQHIHREGIDQMILQANATSAKLDAARQLMLRTPTASFKEMAEVKEKGGSKRDYCHTSELTNPQTVDLMHSQFSSHELSKTSQQKNHISKNDLGTPENHKRKKFEDKCHGVASSLPSSVTSVQDCSGQAESRRSNHIHASSSFSSYIFGRLLNSNFEKQSTFRKQNIGDNVIGNDQCTDTSPIGNGFQEQRSSSKVIYPRDWMVRQENMETDRLTVITRPTDSLMFSTHRVPETTQGNETRTSLVDLSVKRQTVVPVPSIQAFSKKKVHPEESKKEIGSRHSSRKVKGPKEEQNRAVTIDEIIDQMEGLGISNSGKEVVVAKHQNAIVPYKGDGTIVPYKGFDPIKRRRPRPKVDLDSETNRLWNLLMGKALRESTESMDMDKEKWWEEERKVVRGRVDSFIARMHLVQGDRRFSQWKGSVVDSVIGVFLTQNVSDHLSSSAFMSLAAKFPLPPTTLKTTCSENVAIAWIEEPEGQIIDPDGTITYHGSVVRQVFYKQNSLTLSESSERRSENLISGIGTYLANENNSGTEEEVVSSQNSSDSFLQPTDIRSSSDSEVEDQTILCNSSMNCSSETLPKQDRAGKYPCHLMTSPLLNKRPVPGYQLQENSVQNPGLNSGSNVHGYSVNSDALCLQGSLSPSCGSWLNKTSRIGVHEPYCSGSSGHKRMTSFLPMSVEIAKTGGAAHSIEKIGGMAGSTSSPTIQETGMPINHAMKMGQPIYPNQYSKDNLQPGSHSGSSQQSINNNHVHRSNSLQLENMSVIEPKRPDEANANGQTGHVSFLSQPFSSTDTNIPNARKRKHEVDKTKTFDWDSLRKQVLSKGGKKERGRDNMDSLDYEAIRNADVKRISETIKERGMNNMLAERIKDFLNRLVREHGSIDLEWLRDVQSDQAKDYLLSIRGLGLKSVECVRLLTLHQLAFPVDTNVGRIAVRLGWVPLQPLPESLQLHLLELYPVLESIQKYLWPRLCKLDQRTLYELHYQMITFGKVFCTKSKPNCNACPMRAECRHFASAFASARLALPGPGERSVVCSTTSNAANDNLSVTLKPMPLPPGEANEGLESHYIRGICEPIIEEPTTPEPSPEVSEIDIEDLCYEDPDEIPIIKLSFEELKMNVQSIMEDQKMEFQEGDLSRALVALDPSAASIPAPKLKNVSRLRTEHQVYELPDSHPLLKGMDRREPDDPSPYLLAIWTPGETANSTQPPESECSSQASGRLCNEKGCFSCNSIKEANSQTVRGTLLIPCRTAMRGSFPLNGTYFQVNEMFADDESSQNPIDVPRDWLWPLPRRTVYFGTSVSTIFKGLSTEGIQYCFWKGFVCVRGFDRKTRAPRPLKARLHHPASKMVKNKNKDKQKERQS